MFDKMSQVTLNVNAQCQNGLILNNLALTVDNKNLPKTLLICAWLLQIYSNIDPVITSSIETNSLNTALKATEEDSRLTIFL
jgi:hypothetical protein